MAIAYFWLWWLQPHHNIGTLWFVLNSAVLGWFTLVPLYLLSLYIRGRLSAAEVDPPPGRAAMVVTKAASEPWSVVRETLVAMLAQEPHHDTWLADEDPAEATLAWCNTHGVRISTRKGVAPTIAPVGRAGPAARRAIWRTSMIGLATTSMILWCKWTPTTSRRPAICGRC
jgi:hypothetical protein